MKTNQPLIRPMNIGAIGCGNIFPFYALGAKKFPVLNLKSCADLNLETARQAADEYGVQVVSVEQLLADPEIEMVLNLTVPKVHARVSLDILRAGKHVYSEKPLGLDVGEAREMLEFAARKGLRVGCAPDTFFGGAMQTARKLIDDGWIGSPTAGTAFVMGGGPEGWHPNPAFFYQRGGGPMLDLGPYYITGLVHLWGPIQSVSAMTSMLRSERLATCAERFGQSLPVEVATHCSGSLLFKNGAIVSVGVSFDVHKHGHHPIELYGSEGSICIPDPNQFGGSVRLARAGESEWSEIPLAFGYRDQSRGIGVADMATAIRSGRPHRCSGDLALHVLEVMNAFQESQERRAWVDISSSCTQPQPLPLGLLPGTLDR